MELRQEQKQRLEQRLIMTPSLQQSLKILQLSRLELQELIEEELEENPVLEESAKVDETIQPLQTAETDPDEDTSKASEGAPSELDLNIDNWEEYYGGRLSDIGEAPGQPTRQSVLESTASGQPSLRELLTGQLALLDLTADVLLAAKEIIGDIDEDGYFRGVRLDEIADSLNMNINVVEKALQVVQTLEPIGAGARDLAECLLIQLNIPGQKSNRWAKKIITTCFHELETRNIRLISKKLKISPQIIRRALKVISELEPKPGRQYSSEQAKYIVPDLYVEKEEDDYVITINNESLPVLRLNSYYIRLLKKQTKVSVKTRDFLEEKIRSAQRIIRSIAQRQSTLYVVASAIFKFQHDFLEKGLACLRPLKLSQVAKTMGVHESTVSRATSDKYAQTPQGIFELKFFFSPGLAAEAREDVSSRSMKETIRELITSEDKKRPYSDQKLTEFFHRTGVSIARRTVAKYREKLRILPASKRKRY